MGTRVGEITKAESKTSPPQCTFPNILEELRRRWFTCVHFHSSEVHHAGLPSPAAYSISTPTEG